MGRNMACDLGPQQECSAPSGYSVLPGKGCGERRSCGHAGLLRAGISGGYIGICGNVDCIPLSASEISGSRKLYSSNPLPIVSDAIWLAS